MKLNLRDLRVDEVWLEKRRAPQGSDRDVVVFVIGFTYVFAVS